MFKLYQLLDTTKMTQFDVLSIRNTHEPLDMTKVDIILPLWDMIQICEIIGNKSSLYLLFKVSIVYEVLQTID